jgi:ribosomal protein L40E
MAEDDDESFEDDDDFNDLLEQAATDSVIECPKCGATLEPDAEVCSCGWKNLLREMGAI